MNTETTQNADENEDQDAVQSAIEADQHELLTLRARFAALEEHVLRDRAESENQRKRVLRELDVARKYATERLLGDLLPVVDSLEKGLELAGGDQTSLSKLVEGMEMTLKLLSKVVDSHGLKSVDPVGEAFNPEMHQAMALQPAPDAAPGQVLKTLQKGYLLSDRLLRPALVIVAADH